MSACVINCTRCRRLFDAIPDPASRHVVECPRCLAMVGKFGKEGLEWVDDMIEVALDKHYDRHHGDGYDN